MSSQNSERNDGIDKLRDLIHASRHIVGFTGAGISTASGIPDYRSQGGLWERFQPVAIDEFVADEDARIRYWSRKQEVWPAMRDARPGSGHRLLKQFFDRGMLEGIITQNIDGLHEASGIPDGMIANLHGSNLRTSCLSCSYEVPSETVFDNLDLTIGSPHCPACGGLLKPATVSFGQGLDPATLARAEKLAGSCDLMLVLGSTLVVFPAAGLPLFALRSGARLAIVTLSETPLDDAADLVIHRPIEEAAEALMAGTESSA